MFHALADATRRDILRVAATGEHSVSSLARRYTTSFAAVQKHVAVLAEVGLVRKTRVGREQRVTTDVDRVRTARAVLDELAELWRGRMDRFGEVLDEEGADR